MKVKRKKNKTLKVYCKNYVENVFQQLKTQNKIIISNDIMLCPVAQRD